MSFVDFSIIIPVGPGEETWKELLQDLKPVWGEAEILLVGTTPFEPTQLDGNPRWIHSRPGRAHQLNLGAASATRSQLWFLHADSRVTPEARQALLASVRHAPQALHYFDLKFASSSLLLRINEWGARVRSDLLKMPFGDQGFQISTEGFQKVGPFPVSAPYGEDHLWVWRARGREIELKRVGAALLTSSRKYDQQGWRITTAQHLKLTFLQAWPEFRKLYFGKRNSP